MTDSDNFDRSNGCKFMLNEHTGNLDFVGFNFNDLEPAVVDQQQTNFVEDIPMEDVETAVAVTQQQTNYVEDAIFKDVEPFINNDMLPAIKKRKKDPSNWAKNINKNDRMRGNTYFGKKKTNDEWNYKIPKEGKVMKPPCECLIEKSLNCKDFTYEERKQIFKKFWEKCDSWHEKRLMISMLVMRKKPVNLKNRVQDNESRRGNTFRYHLSTEEKILPVCKKMFLNTLGISQKMVYTALSDFSYESTKAKQATRQPVKVTGKRLSAEEFLSKLNKMESHFCRASSSKLYLEPNWTSLLELYGEYKNYCAENKLPILCKSSFYETFDEMNLSLFTPKKDQCDTCVGYFAGNIEDTVYQLHIINKNSAQAEKDNDTKMKKNVKSMDVERVLLSPWLKASLAYYKMKLAVRNFTIFEHVPKDGHCSLWHEGEAGVTGNNFATLVCKYIEDKGTTPGEEHIFFSDGCTNQNRNVYMANALLNMAIQKKITIIQKFLEKGHTHMECDSMHSTIERRLKTRPIYDPKGYVLQCLKARQKQPYHVEYLTHTYFKDFSSVKFLNSIRPGKKKGDPTVTNIRCLKYEPTGEVKYKLSYTDDWKNLPQRIDPNIESVPFKDLPNLYTSACKIDATKYAHLQDLKAVIPKQYHSFYDDLPH